MTIRGSRSLLTGLMSLLATSVAVLLALLPAMLAPAM